MEDNVRRVLLSNVEPRSVRAIAKCDNPSACGGDVDLAVSPAPRLKQMLKTAEKEGVELCLLDTGPQSESAVLSAAKAADYCLVPTRPSLVDLEALQVTSDLLAVARTPSAVVINAWKSEGQKLNAEKALEGSDYVFELCPVTLKDRNAVGYAYAMAQGVTEYDPQGKAAQELNRLWKWVAVQLAL